MARRQTISLFTSTQGLKVGDGPLKICDQSGEWFVASIEVSNLELQRAGWLRRLRARISSLWFRLRYWRGWW